MNIGGYEIGISRHGEVTIHVPWNKARKTYQEEIFLNIYELRELLHKAEMTMLEDRFREILEEEIIR